MGVLYKIYGVLSKKGVFYIHYTTLLKKCYVYLQSDVEFIFFCNLGFICVRYCIKRKFGKIKVKKVCIKRGVNESPKYSFFL